MEAYRTTCAKCGHIRIWTGYKTGLGKTQSQLDQMKNDQKTCVRCGSTEAKTSLDHESPLGRAQDHMMGAIIEALTGSVPEENPIKPHPLLPQLHQWNRAQGDYGHTFTEGALEAAISLLNTACQTHTVPDTFEMLNALETRIGDLRDKDEAWHSYLMSVQDPPSDPSRMFQILADWITRASIHPDDLKSILAPESTRFVGAIGARVSLLEQGALLLQSLQILPIAGALTKPGLAWPGIRPHYLLKSAVASLTNDQSGQSTHRIVAADGALGLLNSPSISIRETLVRVLETCGIHHNHSAHRVIPGRIRYAALSGLGYFYVYRPGANGITPIVAITDREPIASHIALVTENVYTWLSKFKDDGSRRPIPEDQNATRTLMGSHYEPHRQLRMARNPQELLARVLDQHLTAPHR